MRTFAIDLKTVLKIPWIFLIIWLRRAFDQQMSHVLVQTWDVHNILQCTQGNRAAFTYISCGRPGIGLLVREEGLDLEEFEEVKEECPATMQPLKKAKVEDRMTEEKKEDRSWAEDWANELTEKIRIENDEAQEERQQDWESGAKPTMTQESVKRLGHGWANKMCAFLGAWQDQDPKVHHTNPSQTSVEKVATTNHPVYVVQVVSTKVL